MGLPYIARDFLVGKFTEEQNNSSASNSVSVTHNSAGNNVIVTVGGKAFRSYTSSTQPSTIPLTVNWQVRRGATVVESGSSQTVIGYEFDDESGQYLVSEYVGFRDEVIDTGAADQSYTYTFDCTYPTGFSNKNTTIRTYETII